MRDMVLVLNFDDTASRVIARKLRSERVFCKIMPGNTSLEEILEQSPLGILLAGSMTEKTAAGLDERLLKAGIPMLALGDTAALMLSLLGGCTGETLLENSLVSLEYGEMSLLNELENGEKLLPCIRDMALAPDLMPICMAQEHVIGFAHEELPLFGLQFQMEQNDPECTLLLRNFALSICGCTTWWDEDSFVARAVEEIDRVVGDGTAVCAMTGGLDSGVSALLAFKALGRRLKCIFVDTGLLRDQEGDDFISFYRDQIGMDITRIYAQNRFTEALRGIHDADEKRRVIGMTMQEVLSEEKSRLGSFDALIRGTSYNDIMFGKNDRRPALSESVPVIEPVRELFKDEIRRIGDFLGLPQEVISRQPFPGSGLALRILGEVTPERLSTLRAVDAIFRQEVKLSPIAKRLWQFFAVLCPMPGEELRSVICLRAVHASEQSMAYAARLPYDVMEAVVERVRNERPEVSRVVYDLTPSSNYAGVEWQ